MVHGLCSGESELCISFEIHGLGVWEENGEAENPSCLRSSEEFPQSVMIWEPSRRLVLVRRVLSSPESTQQSTRTFESTSSLLLLTSFMERLISFSSRTWALPTLPKVPIPGLMTIGSLCLIGQQTCLT